VGGNLLNMPLHGIVKRFCEKRGGMMMPRGGVSSGGMAHGGMAHGGMAHGGASRLADMCR